MTLQHLWPNVWACGYVDGAGEGGSFLEGGRNGGSYVRGGEGGGYVGDSWEGEVGE